jgi:hypothetical protein
MYASKAYSLLTLIYAHPTATDAMRHMHGSCVMGDGLVHSKGRVYASSTTCV